MMKRAAILLASVAAGMLALAGPASAATFAGVYPSHEAAHQACVAGKQQGRWSNCQYQAMETGPSPQVGLWVS